MMRRLSSPKAWMRATASKDVRHWPRPRGSTLTPGLALPLPPRLLPVPGVISGPEKFKLNLLGKAREPPRLRVGGRTRRTRRTPGAGHSGAAAECQCHRDHRGTEVLSLLTLSECHDGGNLNRRVNSSFKTPAPVTDSPEARAACFGRS